MLLRIFSFLPPDDLVAIATVCRLWNVVVVSELHYRGVRLLEIMHDNFGAALLFTKAISVCEPAAAGILYFRRGVANYKETQEDEAVADLDTALRLLQPDAVDWHIAKSMHLQILHDFRGAVEEATRALELDPTNGAALYLRGYNLFDLQQYDRAIADLTYCLSLPYPYKSKVYNCRGWCFFIIGQRQQALDDFGLSARLNLRYTKPFVNKAIVLAGVRGKSRRDERPTPLVMEEEALLTDYIRHSGDPNLAGVYYTRGSVRQQCENYEGAIEDYRQCIALGHHSSHRCHVSVGWCLEKLDQPEAAIAEYNKAIALRSSYSVAIEYRAGALCRTNSAEAESDCRLAIATNPRNLSFAYRFVAAGLADRGEYDDAVEMLSKGLSKNPLDSDMLLGRAGYLSCAGEFTRARLDYDLCLRYRPDNYEAWRKRGNLRFAQDDVSGAIEDYQTCLKADADDAVVLNNLALALMAAGDLAAAGSHLQGIPPTHKIYNDVRLNLSLLQCLLDNSETYEFDPRMAIDSVCERIVEQKMRQVAKRRFRLYARSVREATSLSSGRRGRRTRMSARMTSADSA